MENQIIDWKEKWKDEYLVWICGFANAQGGRLKIQVSQPKCCPLKSGSMNGASE